MGRSVPLPWWVDWLVLLVLHLAVNQSRLKVERIVKSISYYNKIIGDMLLWVILWLFHLGEKSSLLRKNKSLKIPSRKIWKLNLNVKWICSTLWCDCSTLRLCMINITYYINLNYVKYKNIEFKYTFPY